MRSRSRLLRISLAATPFGGLLQSCSAQSEAPVPSGSDWLVSQVGNGFQILYGNGLGFPQYSFLHVNSGFLCLNDGRDAGWGPSIILLPSLWSSDAYHRGTPVDATWDVAGSDLILTITGTMADLDIPLTVHMYPQVRCIRILADLEATSAGSALPGDRPGEALEPEMLPLMPISPKQLDTQTTWVAEQRYASPEDSWIVWPHDIGQTFALIGGTSEWKVNASSVFVELDEPMTVTGWVTPSTDANDGNVGFWAATDQLLYSWSYRIYTSSLRKCPDPPAGWDVVLLP